MKPAPIRPKTLARKPTSYNRVFEPAVDFVPFDRCEKVRQHFERQGLGSHATELFVESAPVWAGIDCLTEHRREEQ